MRLPEIGLRFRHSMDTGELAVASRWQAADISLLWLLALAPPLLIALYIHRIPILLNGLITIVLFQVWRVLFSRATHTISWQITPHDVVQVAVLALLLPLNASLWQVVVSVSFGYVFAEVVFGGRGFGFLSTSVLALSFQLQGMAIDLVQAPVGLVPFYYLLPGIVGLLFYELVSYRTVIGMFVAIAIMTAWFGDMNDWSWLLATPSLLVAFYAATDPACSASSNPARWVHGFLFGCMWFLLVPTNSASIAPVVYAALVASLAAPLIDHLVVMVHIYRRRRPHGY